MLKLTVNKNRIGPILGRHPWVFSGALKHIPDGIESGAPVELVDDAGTFLAYGYFNSYSQIAVRLWSWDKNELADVGAENFQPLQTFFHKRIAQAYQLRQQYVENKETNAYRLVYAENDFLPGLVVDKYADYLVVQFHTRGMMRWRKEIEEALIEVVKPKGIIERSDAKMRERENTVEVENFQPLQYGTIPDEIKIKENGLTFLVDVKEGQKTGFFLDQRDKRLALQKYVKGRRVLNCFSYTGGFSVYALAAGAEHVVSVDASEPALTMAEKNVQANTGRALKDSARHDFVKSEKSEYILADVKEYLGDLASKTLTSSFDIIILDPPAFIKDRHKIKEGIQGYKKINQLALQALPPDGILVTCSCSQHLSLQDFRFTITEAAARAGRSVQILETFTHGIDHPELSAFTEGEYLKCIFARVL